MTRLLLILFFLASMLSLHAQTCELKNLSKRFNYQLIAKHFKNAQSTVDSADITLIIRDKKSGKLHQKISFGANYLYEDAYKDCTKCRSYITGYHKESEVPDYDYGDLIIADLNFDGREDIAIKNDSGGNGGPIYNFYLQDKSFHFVLNKYLTDSVGSFPRFTSKKNKTITTQIHATATQEGKKTFSYNTLTKKWRLIRWVMVKY